MLTLVKSIDRISCHVDHENNMVEYVGLGILQCPIHVNHVSPDVKLSMDIPAGTPVTYMMRGYDKIEYAGKFTLLVLYYVANDGRSYHFTDSTASSINAAAHMWGLSDYRD